MVTRLLRSDIKSDVKTDGAPTAQIFMFTIAMCMWNKNTRKQCCFSAAVHFSFCSSFSTSLNLVWLANFALVQF